jgi:hypothetical protein
MPRVELASASPLEGEHGQLIEIPRMTAHWPASTIHKAGRGRQLCPGISDVNFLGNLDGIVDLNTEIADGALNFGVAEQELNRTQISGSAVN